MDFEPYVDFAPRGSRAGDDEPDAGSRRSWMYPLQGVRILVVEDNPDHLETMQVYLRQFGANVHAARSAQEGIEAYFAVLPDLVLSDLQMPFVDGCAFLRMLRRAGSQVPAIAVSAYADPEDRARSRDAGFEMHLAKPVTPNALLDAIRSVLPED